jgi:TolA-binding protein
VKPDKPICCDDRAVRVRRDACLSADQQHLIGHLEACPDCRIERQLMADFEQSAAAQPLDEQLIARAAMHALAPIKTRRPAWQRFSAAAGVLLLAGAASAAITLRARHPDRPTTHNAVDPGKVRSPRHAHASTAAGAMVPATVSTVSEPSPQLAAPTITVAHAPTAPAVKVLRPVRPAGSPRLTEASPGSRQPEPPVGPAERVETAASLFASALEDRDGGQLARAISTLRALEQRFPNSSQALVARVSLGDLLLREGRVAESLLAFDLYLARAPSGNLAPEALAGKVRALDLLGRTDEAEVIRREIARRFPHFLYGATAARP